MSAVAVNCSRCDDPLRMLRYAMREGRHAALGPAMVIAANVSTFSAKAAARELRAVADLRPTIKKRYMSIVLSIPQRARGRRRWNALVTRILERVGLDPSKFPFTASRHFDTQNDHVHVVCTRVAVDGSVWGGEWELSLLQTAAQDVARELGLEADPAVFAEHYLVVRANRRLQRLGKPLLFGRKVCEVLEACLELAQDFESFVSLASTKGVALRKKLNDDGTAKGLVVDMDGLDHGMSLSTVSRRRFSLPRVERALLKNSQIDHDHYAETEWDHEDAVAQLWDRMVPSEPDESEGYGVGELNSEAQDHGLGLEPEDQEQGGDRGRESFDHES